MSLKLTDTIRFEPIKEDRGPYFVEYHVPNENDQFAVAYIVCHQAMKPETVAKAMEAELDRWARRYPVPIMVTAFNDTEEVVDLTTIRSESHLFGWLDDNGRLEVHWRLVRNDEIPSSPFTIERLIETYPDIPRSISTAEDKRRDIQQTRRRNHAVRNIVIVWFVAIPVGVALFAQFVAWAGWAATGVSVLAGFWKLSGIMGWRKKSKYQAEKEAEEARMRHHHYWCERNPEGFARLRFEARNREIRAQILEDAEELKRRKG
jgi:hypothetical protein